jgi:hypothetical protein
MSDAEGVKVTEEDGMWVVTTPFGQRGGRWVHEEDAIAVAQLPEGDAAHWAREANYWREKHRSLLRKMEESYDEPDSLMALHYRHTVGSPGSPEDRRYIGACLAGMRRRAAEKGQPWV